MVVVSFVKFSLGELHFEHHTDEENSPEREFSSGKCVGKTRKCVAYTEKKEKSFDNEELFRAFAFNF